MPDVTVDDLLDKETYDVNGHHLGRITLCREDNAGLRSFDVELDRAARRALQTERSTLTVPADEVVATDFDVTLAEEGLLLAHPERAPPAQRPPDRL